MINGTELKSRSDKFHETVEAPSMGCDACRKIVRKILHLAGQAADRGEMMYSFFCSKEDMQAIATGARFNDIVETIEKLQIRVDIGSGKCRMQPDIEITGNNYNGFRMTLSWA